MNNESTGRLIRAIRTEKGITQKQLADTIGVSNAAVSKWENGHGFPDISLLEPLADALGITVAELLSGQQNASPDEDTVRDIIALSQQQKQRSGMQTAVLTVFVTVVCLVGLLVIAAIAPLRFAAAITRTNADILLNLGAIGLGLAAWGCAAMGMFAGRRLPPGGWKGYTIASLGLCCVSLWLPLLLMTAYARMEDTIMFLDTMGGYNFGAMFLLFVTFVLNIASWYANRNN